MRITVKDIKTSLGITETYDIVNAIRNSNPNFANYVPLATADNVAEMNIPLLENNQPREIVEEVLEEEKN